MLFYALIIITVVITGVMFMAKEPLLGFPCLIFWALLGGYCYQQSTVTWDLYYLTFFASMGMAIFTGYAAFAIRRRDLDAKKSDWLDAGGFIDEEGKSKNGESGSLAEGKDRDVFIDEPGTPNKRTLALRQRAAERRTGGRKLFRWGEFK